MSVAETLAEHKAILGKRLPPAAISRVREDVIRLKEGDGGDTQSPSPSKRL